MEITGNEGNSEPRSSRVRKPSAIAIRAALYEQHRPYRRGSTKSPQKRKSPVKQKAQKKQKALIERTNTFTFNDQPPPPPAKKVKVAAGVGVPVNRQVNPQPARTTTKSSAADSQAIPTAQPRHAEHRANPPAAAGPTTKYRRMPGWATPIPGSLEDFAALPRPREIICAPPLVLPPHCDHPNQPSAPPAQPSNGTSPTLPVSRKTNLNPSNRERRKPATPVTTAKQGLARTLRIAFGTNGYDEMEMDEIEADPEAGREEEEGDEVEIPEDDFYGEDDEGEGNEIGDGSPEDGGNGSDDEAEADQGGGRCKRHRKTGESERDAIVRKASSFGPMVGAAIQMACRYVRSVAITKNPLASVEEEEKIVHDAWPIVTQLKPFRGQSLPWNEIYYPTIKQYFSNVRGRVVGHCRTLLGRYFPFRREAGSKRANTKLYKDLIEDDAYTCEDPKNLDGRWSHPLLLEVIYASFFPTRSSDGFRFGSKFFNPITLELVAIVFTAIRCSLDEWAKGVYMKLQFKTSVYTPVYERHLENLKALKRHDRKAITEFCGEIWEYASGAQGGASMEPGPILCSEQHAKAAQDLREHARRKREARQANQQNNSSEIDD
ncbi:hypothetical protein FS837_010457 [Tulasnella sp. UAMH 9824]|nr:hypothetical protein FS837_010457 [Tulasnella sp. UAMH 9824]